MPRTSISALILIIVLTISLNKVFSQDQIGKAPFFLEVNVKKTGPYLGLQQGKYMFLEIGAERIWKKLRLKKPFSQAVHMGFNYNVKHNVLGYDVGYWCRPHRFGLTYGANLFFRTDFDRGKIGVAPVLGYKVWFVHIQTGYNFMPRPSEFETNTFFISLRASIINDRDVDIKRKKRK